MDIHSIASFLKDTLKIIVHMVTFRIERVMLVVGIKNAVRI